VTASISDERQALAEEILAYMQCVAQGQGDCKRRDALLDQVLAWQYAHVPAYRAYVDSVTPHVAEQPPNQWPALPTDVFRYTRVAAHSPTSDAKLFMTSGTTHQSKGTHPLADTALYDKAAFLAARHTLFMDHVPMRLVILAPSEQQAPHSSLAYMLARFGEWFGQGESIYVWRDNHLDMALLCTSLKDACQVSQPVALLGTSLAFAHALDALGSTWSLPPTSRIMLTGGSKGTSREVSSDSFRLEVGKAFGIQSPYIVSEYGMTELCSQLYDLTLQRHHNHQPVLPGTFWSPGWTRARVIDPRTGAECPDGEVGVIRIDDLANLDTVCAIQTSDLGIHTSDGLVLLGRSADAVPRGCSLEADSHLSPQRYAARH
jgi:hypothetical protein